MILDVELEEDVVAAAELAETEKEMGRRIKALLKEVKRLEDRAVELRSRLDETSQDEIAELEEDLAAARWKQYEIVSEALGGEYTPADVASWCIRAVGLGCVHPRLGPALISDFIRHRKVPNAQFREAVSSSPKTMYELADIYRRQLVALEEADGADYGSRSMEHYGRNKSDGSAFGRLVGMFTKQSSQGRSTVQIAVSYEQAVALSRALNFTPHEAGV